MNYQHLWEYFVKTSEATGEISNENGIKGQAAYSLYTAFYKKNNDYSKLNSELIKGFFGETKLSFYAEENVDDKIKKQFGETAIDRIKERQVNSDQKKAIRHGLVQPVTLVQGPPGTGKTEMILNFLAVITELSPESTVAVVSCNAEALSNITDALKEGKAQAIKSDDPDNIMVKVCNRCAILGSKEKRKAWSPNVDSDDFVDRNNYIFSYKLLEKYPIFTSTIHSLPNIFNNYPKPFDYVIIDECSQVSVSLGLVAMAHAKRLMLVGDDLQLQAIIDKKAIKNTKAEDKSVEKYL